MSNLLYPGPATEKILPPVRSELNGKQGRNVLLTATVLAGGNSTRLGHDKAFTVVNGETVIERVMSVVSGLTDNVLLITSQRKQALFRGTKYETNMVLDIYPDKGSLGAIYTGLKYARTPYILAVACDMPFINLQLLQFMANVASDRCFDAVVPSVNGNLEPLHAMYSKSCLAAIESLLAKDRLRVSELFNIVKTRYVEENELRIFDRNGLSFFNINTKEDIQKAESISCLK